MFEFPLSAVKLMVAVPATEKSEFVREGQRREVMEVGVVITSQVKPLGLSGKKTIGVISAGASVGGRSCQWRGSVCVCYNREGLGYGRRTIVGERGWNTKSRGISASEAIGHSSRRTASVDIFSAGEGARRECYAHGGKE